MHAMNQDDIAIADEDAPRTVLSHSDARGEDAHWAREHSRERYFRPGLEYEDYAPAYCVGYIGFAQYGGRFEDAERSLVANWVRIKGDSRLGLDDALLAIRAAWDRMAGPLESCVDVASAPRLERGSPQFMRPHRAGAAAALPAPG